MGWVNCTKLNIFVTFVLCQYNVSRNGCWQKSKHAAGGPTHNSTHHSKHGDVHYHPSLSKVRTSMKLIRTRNQGERMISHGTQACSQDIIDSNRGYPELSLP